MSAIVGLWNRDGRSADTSRLDRAASRLDHRGPDGSCSWNEGPVGFSARILQTRTASADERPIGRLGDALVVAADARVDNRHELAARLRIEGVAEWTDVDIILAAYRAWGRDTPKRLIGDFAFAIWDGERRSLFCARDTIGARPFLYHLTDRLFAFASEAKALLCLPDVPDELDEVQVALYLGRVVDDPERTFHHAIRRLPAAHVLEVSPAGIRMERYWAPESGRRVLFASDEEYAEAFREIFLESVRCRMPRDASVGAALSGGLDSSSVVCAARRLTPPDRPVHAFSAVFPGLPPEEREWNDESAFIDDVVDIPGIIPHRVHADRISPLADYDRVLRHHDGPPLAFNLYMRWALLAAAQREGLKVFLDGTDGDSVVSKGYELFIDLANEGDGAGMVREVQALTLRTESPRDWFPKQLVYPQLIRLARAGRWVTWGRIAAEVCRGLGRSRSRLLLRYGAGALVPGGQRFGGARSRDSGGDLIRADFARRTGLRERARELRRTYSGPRSTSREDHAQVLSLPRYQYAMELIDATASAFGIKHRFPFFDRRLVEFCIAIPPDQKLRDGWTRWIQRRAMEGILPPSVQWRVAKGNLGYNFVRGMRMTEGPKLEAELFGKPSLLGDFVNMDVLRKTLERFLASEPGLTANDDAMALYQAAVLGRWLRSRGSGGAP